MLLSHVHMTKVWMGQDMSLCQQLAIASLCPPTALCLVVHIRCYTSCIRYTSLHSVIVMSILRAGWGHSSDLGWGQDMASYSCNCTSVL